MKTIKILAAACVFTLVTSAGAVSLSWNDLGDVQDSNGATSYLTATGFNPGGTIVNGNEGSFYFSLSWGSNSDVQPFGSSDPFGGSGGVVYILDPDNTTMSDWASISLEKGAGSGGFAFTYTINGFFQSDSPGNGMPTSVPNGFAAVIENGSFQDITGSYQYQDFSGPPYPILFRALPSDLTIAFASDVDARSAPDGGSTLMLLALSLGALVLGSRWVRRPVLQRF